jgi:hypothetical protein
MKLKDLFSLSTSQKTQKLVKISTNVFKAFSKQREVPFFRKMEQFGWSQKVCFRTKIMKLVFSVLNFPDIIMH